jgi:DNA-binding NarL/FixJ family response regulator
METLLDPLDARGVTMALLMALIKILVVDDYEPFCELIYAMLQRPEFQVVGQVSDGLEAVQSAQELQPDLILLDVSLPSLNGLEAAKRIRELAPSSKILFISQESDCDVVQEALGLGALGYVHKSRAQTELWPAIEAVLAGRQFVSSGIKSVDHAESVVANGSHSTRLA